jgi:glyoxylase-like metal-dependent hydrolase (beta-lactamase superfamily II)
MIGAVGILVAVLLFAGTADIRMTRIAEGVHVASRPDPLRPYVEGNATIIINEHDVVVVDASGSPRVARKVIAEIRKLTPNPVRYVVLTHIHRDHRFGLQEYHATFPGVEVIAHPLVKEIIDRPSSATFVAGTIQRLEKSLGESEADLEKLRREAAPEVVDQMRRYYERDLPAMIEEYRRIRNLGPTTTVDSQLTLHRGQRSIEIRFLGRGDTDHDLIVYLPKEKVVVAGDMVVHPFPYGFSQQPREWLATLGKLSALDFELLVPGHGDVQRGKHYLQRIISLIDSVRVQTANGIAAGLDLEAIRKRIDLTAFERELAGDDPIRRHYFHDYFVRPGVERSYKEQSGK